MSKAGLFGLGLILLLKTATTVGFESYPTVNIDTSLGTIVVELYPDKAPKTVENFLAYVESGHYEGTIFHRTLPGYIIQGGGFDHRLKEKLPRDPIPSEADNGLKNERGAFAMARTSDPHSAKAQFYINVGVNPALDHRAKTPRDWGYTVFGKVIRGISVAQVISEVPTGNRGRHRNVPILPVVIKRVWVN